MTTPATHAAGNAAPAPDLLASAVTHRYGGVVALADATVQVPSGQMLALVGESGSGKSTMLRCFNRMVEPDTGAISIGGRAVRDVDAVELRRRIGYVPQDGGLLPHWTVLRNVALVPRLSGHETPERAARDALERCGLSAATFGSRYPHELSGGQRQRAAIARALAASQRVVLLDESFSALDAISRHELVEAFSTLRRDAAFTAILVTHDLAEAARLADSIAVMRAGRVEQCASLATLRESPATTYVAALFQRAAASARALAAP
jgi:osmoprotectant transport system ATP-binding protein